ncbi:MAG: dUTP diphosphatase [Clostridia bacterium]|nr:dUTP diphosphatase [Clostridia bacterium]
MKINFIKLNEKAHSPKRATEGAAGADLYAITQGSITIKPHTTCMIHTGIALEIPEGMCGLIFARSGLASKKGLAPANKVGLIDSDYRGEIMVALHNHTDEDRVIDDGERVAQLVIMPYVAAEYSLCDSLSDTDRGEGGFGSTGTK